jgi:UDP-glucose 4-epimerase
MRALVTGGAGFIGSTLVDFLVSLGHEVIVIDNESADCNDTFFWNKSAENHKLDVSDYEKTIHLYNGVDTVFHLAAEARIQPCIINPLKAVHTNVFGTATVLQCARTAGVRRVIYSSTSSAYGLMNQPPLIETMPNDCLNPYSVSKVAGEELCKMYAQMYGMETVIFRYFNVYGERQPVRGQYATVTGIFLRQSRCNEPLTIVGDGEQRRDFVHVRDVALANFAAAICSPTSVDWKWGQIYNIGSGTNYSIKEIAHMIGDDFLHIPPRIGEARHTLSDSSKAFRDFSWKAQTDIKEWLGFAKEMNL